MNLRQNWSEWWRRFFDLSRDNSHRVVDVCASVTSWRCSSTTGLNSMLRRCAIRSFAKNFFSSRLRKNDAERIAQKIHALGGQLPGVPDIPPTDEKSWRQLLTALEEDYRSDEHLAEQLRSLESDHHDVLQFLQQISQEQKKHRDEIREMLMRSDPFAYSLA